MFDLADQLYFDSASPLRVDIPVDKCSPTLLQCISQLIVQLRLTGAFCPDGVQQVIGHC